VLLAWAMNDEPIPRVHGAPVRIVVPGWMGARSVKWIQRITVQAQPPDNYFQAIDYRVLPADARLTQAGARAGAGISLGPVAFSADILRPEEGAHLHSGPAEVAGYAFAGDCRGIARVDVSIGRTWTCADFPLLRLPNVAATAHIAGCTDGTARCRAVIVAGNIRRIAAGLEPLHRVA
jgi:sulfite oxidase